MRGTADPPEDVEKNLLSSRTCLRLFSRFCALACRRFFLFDVATALCGLATVLEAGLPASQLGRSGMCMEERTFGCSLQGTF
jgi:hypothetical protein